SVTPEQAAAAARDIVRNLKASEVHPKSSQPQASLDSQAVPGVSSDLPQFFGGWGGRYVPETLVGALDELEAAWQQARSDETFQAEIRKFDGNSSLTALQILQLHRASNPPVPLPAAERSGGGCADLAEARGHVSHRGAQDQQRSGAGAAGATPGKATRHSGD